MLPYQRVSSKEITITELAQGVTLDVLRRETTLMNDRVLGLIAECTEKSDNWVQNAVFKSVPTMPFTGAPE